MAHWRFTSFTVRRATKAARRPSEIYGSEGRYRGLDGTEFNGCMKKGLVFLYVFWVVTLMSKY